MVKCAVGRSEAKSAETSTGQQTAAAAAPELASVAPPQTASQPKTKRAAAKADKPAWLKSVKATPPPDPDGN